MGTSGSAVGSLRSNQSIVSNEGGGGSGNSLAGYMKSRPSGACVSNTTTTKDGRIVIGANTPTPISTITTSEDAPNATSANQKQPTVSLPSPPSGSMKRATSTDNVAATVSSTPNVGVETTSSSSTVVKTAVTATTTAPIVKSGVRCSASESAEGDSTYSPTPIQRPQGTPSELRM